MVALTDVEFLGEEVGDASNVLILAPAFTPDLETWCTCLLDHAAGESGAVLYVGRSAPADHVESWRSREPFGSPRRLGFLTLGGTGTPGGVPTDQDGPDVVLRTVETPGNLTKIGVELNDILTGWAESDLDIAVCLESLTPLIQYSDIEKVYRFIHVLSNQVRAVDASAHYHLDPGAHDETDVNLFMTMVDAVVEPGDDRTVEVRTR